MDFDAENSVPEDPDGPGSWLPTMNWLEGAPRSFYRNYDGVPDLIVDPRTLPERLAATDEALAQTPLRFVIRCGESLSVGEIVSVSLLIEPQGAHERLNEERGILVVREELDPGMSGQLRHALDAMRERFGFDRSSALAFSCRLWLDGHDEWHRYLRQRWIRTFRTRRYP